MTYQSKDNIKERHEGGGQKKVAGTGRFSVLNVTSPIQVGSATRLDDILEGNAKGTCTVSCPQWGTTEAFPAEK